MKEVKLDSPLTKTPERLREVLEALKGEEAVVWLKNVPTYPKRDLLKVTTVVHGILQAFLKSTSRSVQVPPVAFTPNGFFESDLSRKLVSEALAEAHRTASLVKASDADVALARTFAVVLWLGREVTATQFPAGEFLGYRLYLDGRVAGNLERWYDFTTAVYSVNGVEVEAPSLDHATVVKHLKPSKPPVLTDDGWLLWFENPESPPAGGVRVIPKGELLTLSLKKYRTAYRARSKTR